jgi:hypothetical protein
MELRLAWHERALLRLHLVICSACRTYRRQLLLIRRTLREGNGAIDDLARSAGLALSPGARARIERAVEERL